MILGSQSKERIPTVMEEVNSLAAVIETYREREGSYPTSLVELLKSGYLPRLPTDFWGISYNYSIDRPPVASETRPFYVWTLGRDNRTGGEGPDRDVGNW